MTSGAGSGAASAVFLDRDGVINDPVWDETDQRYESPLRPEQVELAAGAVEGLLALRAGGRLLLVVSNQPAAAKGKATLDDLAAVHDRVVQLLADAGITIDGWRYCHHHPDGIVDELTGDCDCRKPKPGMLLDAAAEFGVDLANSWMIGDSDADIQAGIAAGCATAIVENPKSEHRRSANVIADVRAADLAAVARTVGESS